VQFKRLVRLMVDADLAAERLNLESHFVHKAP